MQWHFNSGVILKCIKANLCLPFSWGISAPWWSHALTIRWPGPKPSWWKTWGEICASTWLKSQRLRWVLASSHLCSLGTVCSEVFTHTHHVEVKHSLLCSFVCLFVCVQDSSCLDREFLQVYLRIRPFSQAEIENGESQVSLEESWLFAGIYLDTLFLLSEDQRVINVFVGPCERAHTNTHIFMELHFCINGVFFFFLLFRFHLWRTASPSILQTWSSSRPRGRLSRPEPAINRFHKQRSAFSSLR